MGCDGIVTSAEADHSLNRECSTPKPLLFLVRSDPPPRSKGMFHVPYTMESTAFSHILFTNHPRPRSKPDRLWNCLGQTLVPATADRAINQILGGGVRVARATDPAEDAVSGGPTFLAAAHPLVTEPKDENPRQKQGQIDRHKPGKRDGNHGLVGEGEGVAGEILQTIRARPQVMSSAGEKRRARIQTRPDSSASGFPLGSTRTQERGIPSGLTAT
jgi:hypothetical protein